MTDIIRKYFVIATKWSEKEKKQIRVIVGEFYTFASAKEFKEIYSETYKTYAEIVEFTA